MTPPPNPPLSTWKIVRHIKTGLGHNYCELENERGDIYRHDLSPFEEALLLERNIHAVDLS